MCLELFSTSWLIEASQLCVCVCVCVCVWSGPLWSQRARGMVKAQGTKRLSTADDSTLGSQAKRLKVDKACGLGTGRRSLLLAEGSVQPASGVASAGATAMANQGFPMFACFRFQVEGVWSIQRSET